MPKLRAVDRWRRRGYGEEQAADGGAVPAAERKVRPGSGLRARIELVASTRAYAVASPRVGPLLRTSARGSSLFVICPAPWRGSPEKQKAAGAAFHFPVGTPACAVRPAS